MGENDETKCDHVVMANWYIGIQSLMVQLSTIKETADTMYKTFVAAYEGDAKEEIELFMTSLSGNLSRLIAFYSKMASFISITSQSLLESDLKMTQNMEG